MTDGCLKQIVTKFQEAAFFKITMKRQWEKHGLVIICKSAQMSKFKLVLFDKDGGVRTIQVRFFFFAVEVDSLFPRSCVDVIRALRMDLD